MCIHLPYQPIKYLAYMVYMPNLVEIFASSTYLAIACEVYIAFSCVLVYVCKEHWVSMSSRHVGCVTYNCNVPVVFIQ